MLHVRKNLFMHIKRNHLVFIQLRLSMFLNVYTRSSQGYHILSLLRINVRTQTVIHLQLSNTFMKTIFFFFKTICDLIYVHFLCITNKTNYRQILIWGQHLNLDLLSIPLYPDKKLCCRWRTFKSRVLCEQSKLWV